MNIAIIEINEPNLRNDHIYLSGVMGLFPESAIGGSSKAAMAPDQLELHVGFDEPVITDIARDKKMFRKRAWVREFFKRHNLKTGDKLVIERLGEFRYHIYPQRG
jgi:hypothetical protein